MKIFVTGIGWAGAAGMGAGRGGAPFALPSGKLPQISRRDLFPDPDPRFGRLDAFSRLGLAGVTLALRDSGIEDWARPRAVGIAASTTYGCMGTDLDYLATLGAVPGLASPQLFAYTLPNVFIGEAAIRFGLTGPSLIVSDEDGSGTAALETAADFIADGAGAALAGICDLARPAFLPEIPGHTPGVLFLVLERRPTRKPLGALGSREMRRRSPDGAGGLRALAERLCTGGRTSCPSPMKTSKN